MNYSIKCTISLSKKLRSVLGENTKLHLSTIELNNGVGQAYLIIDSDITPDILLNSETSIMITPIEIKENNDMTETVCNIFAKNITNEEIEKSSLRKIAATNSNTSPKARVEMLKETPQEFKETQDVHYQKYISTFNELLNAIDQAKYKTSSIVIDNMPENTPQEIRAKAVAREQKEQEESIGIDAFIVNEKFASLDINDLGISLSLNAPINISRISAKRLSGSSTLRSLIEKGDVRIVSPEEAKKISKNATQIEDFGLKTFSKPEEAEDAMFSQHQGATEIDMTDYNGEPRSNGAKDNEPTRFHDVKPRQPRTDNYQIPKQDIPRQESQRSFPVVQNTQKTSGTTLTGNVRKTSHRTVIDNNSPRTSGITLSGSSKTIPIKATEENKQGFKTIAKKV